jgi:hypothetical protein
MRAALALGVYASEVGTAVAGADSYAAPEDAVAVSVGDRFIRIGDPHAWNGDHFG